MLKKIIALIVLFTLSACGQQNNSDISGQFKCDLNCQGICNYPAEINVSVTNLGEIDLAIDDQFKTEIQDIKSCNVIFKSNDEFEIDCFESVDCQIASYSKI